MSGVFVTGTDTGVGKTVICAALVRAWGADYWKPAQTGLAEDAGDSAAVARLAQAGPARIHPPRHSFLAPLSPEAAAAREGKQVRLSDFTLPQTAKKLVVEGAGGVLVPLGGGALMVDLMRHLGLPVLLAARSTLGTINHTLLSLEVLRARAIPVWGVVMVGPAPEENAAAIAHYSGARVLAMLPLLASVAPETVAQLARLMPPPPASPNG